MAAEDGPFTPPEPPAPQYYHCSNAVQHSLFPPFARSLDAAVHWRLGKVPFDVPQGLTFEAVDPEGFWRDSRVLHPRPVQLVRHLGVGGNGTRLVDLEGSSSGPGRHPGAAKLIARARLQPAGVEAPLVLILHGFAVPAPIYDERYARMFAASGAHAVRLDLPFHLRRRVRDRCSGAGFFGADLELVRGSIRQSVEDAAAIVAWSRSRLTSRVLILGFSLGGLVALLLAAQTEVDGLVAVVPFCDPPHTFLERLPGRARRKIGLVGGSGGVWGSDTDAARAVLDASLAPLVPANLKPLTAGGIMTLISAGLDTVVGPGPIHELGARWDAEVWDYPRHGHMSVLSARGLAARIHRRLLPERAPAEALQPTLAREALDTARYTAGVAADAAELTVDRATTDIRLAG
ncbi:MAG: alpha/beta fold hydrolase [Candidatus Dormibacteria bacterium]